MEQLSHLVIEPVPANAPFVWLTITYPGNKSNTVHGWLLLEGRLVSYGTAMPYLPVRELLKAYFQIEEHDEDQRVLQAKLAQR